MNISNELDERCATEKTPSLSECEDESECPMIDAFFRVNGAQKLVKMINMNYDE